MPKYRLKWTGGRSAQVEIFSPPDSKQRQFLKYSPALRPSLRTVQECLAASTSLQMANVELDNAVHRLRAAGLVVAPAVGLPAGLPAPSVAPALAVAPVLKSLEQAGMALSDFVANSPAEADLRSPGLFLELGTDEALVNYPWELLHDGDDFLCLKHYLGRYVNTTRISAPRMQPQNSPSEYDKIRILLISVPAAPGASYLPGAQAETVSLVQALSPLPQVELTLMKAPEATVMNVRSEIRSGQYQIVHFCGHAAFNSVDPRRSALMLCDNPLEAGIILLHLKSVVLSFVNACQTAQQAPQPPAWETEFNTFSLARAFMEAESYLLGSRWKLSDKAAPVFATSFYKALLEEWKPIGEAVVAARKACRQASMPDDVGWASYVYYGDPRLGFEPVS